MFRFGNATLLSFVKDVFQRGKLQLAVNKHIAKQNLGLNHEYSILRLFDTLPNFLFTTSKTKHEYW